MFHVKICGVTSAADAALVAEAGADAMGLNFYRGSPRFVTPEQAEAVVATLPAGVVRVGVFVNAPVAEMADLADRLQLDWIQLHGDEPPQRIAELAPRRVLRAWRGPIDGPQGAAEFLRRCQADGCLPAAMLWDAAVDGAYGGTGRTADWGTLKPPRDWLLGLPLVLAGGLTPQNVAEAVGYARPDAVDTASGVESSPRRKDAQRVREFVRAARAALGVTGRPAS